MSAHAQTPDPRRWWTLGAVCVATFMLLLDVTIVNVALPDIQKDLGSSFQDLQWVVDAYALTLAAFLLTAGSLADRLGRRRIFVGGLALFTVASLLCGLSSAPTPLNLARALQGVGGAAMFATSLALLAAAFTGRERGTAFGIWGATTGASVAVGPLVGGVLVEHVSWQSIFFVNLPIGLAAIAVTLRMVKESQSPDPDPIDWPGLVTFSLGLLALVFALV
ncbi:MAG: MFS transporter, partial [Baekduia sp.]